MGEAVIVITCKSVSRRFKVFVMDQNEKIYMTGQIREYKAMCLDEIRSLRKVAHKDSSYQRTKKDTGYLYILRDALGTELGRGNICETEELMNAEIEFMKANAADAPIVDESPEEEQIYMRDLLIELTSEIIEEKGYKYE